MKKKLAPLALDSFLEGHLLVADPAPLSFKTRGGGGGRIQGPGPATPPCPRPRPPPQPRPTPLPQPLAAGQTGHHRPLRTGRTAHTPARTGPDGRAGHAPPEAPVAGPTAGTRRTRTWRGSCGAGAAPTRRCTDAGVRRDDGAEKDSEWRAASALRDPGDREPSIRPRARAPPPHAVFKRGLQKRLQEDVGAVGQVLFPSNSGTSVLLSEG